MDVTIFYSWMSDLPNSTNRGFIEKALEGAASAIRTDDSIKIEPRIDKDTNGISGSPNIPQAILDKIDACQIFVCDISIINAGSKFRQTPNPNVLFELGYALKLSGWNRILLVFNEAYGNKERLPFDLDKRRVIPYRVHESVSDKAPERQRLQSILKAHLEVMVNDLVPELLMLEGVSQPQPELTATDIIYRREINKRNRTTWRASEKSVDDCRRSARAVFKIILDRLSLESVKYYDLNVAWNLFDDIDRPAFEITFMSRQAAYFGWTPAFVNTIDQAVLTTTIETSTEPGNKDFKLERYLPDIDDEGEIVWSPELHPTEKLRADGLAKRLFKRFNNQLARYLGQDPID